MAQVAELYSIFGSSEIVWQDDYRYITPEVSGRVLQIKRQGLQYDVIIKKLNEETTTTINNVNPTFNLE